MQKLSRRNFISAGASLAVGAACAGTTAAPQKAAKKPAAKKPAAKTPAPQAPAQPTGALIDSAPVLQNAAATSIGVAFTVTGDASGWVEYATTPDLKNAMRAYSGEQGMMDISERVVKVRLTGLKPATRYYYRIGADRIDYKGGYAMRNLGPEVVQEIHSFTTLGPTATGSFCVINDTHEHKPALKRVFTKIAELKPSVVVWNGDASNTSETLERVLDVFVRPHPDFPAYAADTPYLFLNGNHDYRGRANRHLRDVMMGREPAERGSVFAGLPRNFVQRLGDIALIGLDTGEDKLDTNPLFANVFRMREYRELQAKWLAAAVESEEVKTAKFKVAFCHIPLYDGDPAANPGDVAPADKSPAYRNDFAIWQRTCAQLWSPSFERAGVQLVITAHQHHFRYDAPTATRPWAQIVGGGCGENLAKHDFPTVIEGKVVDGRLVVRVFDVLRGTLAKEMTFQA